MQPPISAKKLEPRFLRLPTEGPGRTHLPTRGKWDTLSSAAPTSNRHRKRCSIFRKKEKRKKTVFAFVFLLTLQGFLFLTATTKVRPASGGVNQSAPLFLPRNPMEIRCPESWRETLDWTIHTSAGIGLLVPGGRAGPCDHVTTARTGDWLSGKGIATAEGAFPRGLSEGRGCTKRGWALRVMAAPWPRVHLYRSLGPVTKESRCCCLPLSRVDPGAGESQCRSPAAVLREAPGDGVGGKSEGRGRR